jgi:Fe-S-cluster-containing hydrogenase component 2
MACVEACSLFHEGKISYRRSRIQIARDKIKAVFVPLLCEMCKGHCQDVCPEDAYRFDSQLGTPVLMEEKCDGCLKCVVECPFEGINYDKVNKKAVKCDLCGGDPICVKVCQPEALIGFEPKRDQLLKKYENACAKMGVYYEKIVPKVKEYRKRKTQKNEVQ